jgi:hypothetical protein
MAIDATLTKTEKKKVFKDVVAHKLDPAEFDWTEYVVDQDGGSYRMSKLGHSPSGYYCMFGRNRLSFSPGGREKVAHESYPHDDLSQRWLTVSLWLDFLREEVDAPDLWASIGQEKALATAASSTTLDNRLFTLDEHQQIAKKLDDIKGYILEGQTFNAQQADSIEGEFIYLREASERLGRKDWLNNLIGGLFALAVGLALDPAKAKGLMAMAGAALQSLWEGTQGLLR